MKKILSILLILFLLPSCVQNASEFRKKDWPTREKILLSRDVQINLVDGDSKNIYLGTYSDTEEKYHAYSHKVNPSNKWFNPIGNVAKDQCIKNFNLEKPVKLSLYLPTKKEIKDKQFHFKKYTKYLCEKSYEQILAENEKKETEKKINEARKKKESLTSKSTNTRNVSFTCSFTDNPSEKSKISINGPTAYETTAIGIKITYFSVENDNGVFTLTNSSKDMRAWVIGNKSILLIGTEAAYEYDCD